MPRRSHWSRSPLSRSLPWLALLLIVQGFQAPQAQATLLQLDHAYIVGRLPDESVATTAPRTSTPEAPITLYLVLEGRATGRPPTYFTEAPAVDLGWGPIPASQLRRWDVKTDGEITVRWSQLEPEKHPYDNAAPKFHFEPIVYQEVKLPRLDGRWAWEAAIHPTLMPDPAADIPTGLGMIRFKARIEQQGVKVETPGAAGAFPGGISEDVPWAAYRGLDPDPMVSWVQARFNVPYVNGSYRRSKSQDSHQAMLGVGTDSVDLVTAAWRLAGHREVDFLGPLLLDAGHDPKATVMVTRGRPEDGTYINQSGKPLEVGSNGVLPGDLLKSGNQAGVYARDLPPLGLVDSGDLVVSALFQEPRIGSIQALLDGPLTVLRWNELRELQYDLKQLELYTGPIDGEIRSSLLAGVAKVRALVGLPPLEGAEIEARLPERNGTFVVLPAAARFDALRRSMHGLDLDPLEASALMQRVLARAGEAMGAPGQNAMTWTAPREGLDAKSWGRAAGEPFKREGATFWKLEKYVDEIGQTFPIEDADRDGRLDATKAGAPVLAAGPGIVVGLERGWEEKKPAESAKALGNQVWLYVPRAEVLVGYLSLGEVSVKLGQVVAGGAVLGTVGRSGEGGSRKRTPTRLQVVAFSSLQGAVLPIDPAGRWGRELPANPVVAERVALEERLRQEAAAKEAAVREAAAKEAAAKEAALREAALREAAELEGAETRGVPSADIAGQSGRILSGRSSRSDADFSHPSDRPADQVAPPGPASQ